MNTNLIKKFAYKLEKPFVSNSISDWRSNMDYMAESSDNVTQKKVLTTPW